MCSVILRIAYAAQGAPDAMVQFDDEATAMERLANFQKLDAVASVTVFRRGEKYQRTTAWEKV